MILLGKRTLTEFTRSHAEAKPAIESWVAEVEDARWHMPQDIRDRFGRTVSFLADNHVIFDLKGNKFRLEVQFAYPPVATSNSPTRGRVKLLHPDGGGTGGC